MYIQIASLVLVIVRVCDVVIYPSYRIVYVTISSDSSLLIRHNTWFVVIGMSYVCEGILVYNCNCIKLIKRGVEVKQLIRALCSCYPNLRLVW